MKFGTSDEDIILETSDCACASIRLNVRLISPLGCAWEKQMGRYSYVEIIEACEKASGSPWLCTVNCSIACFA